MKTISVPWKAWRGDDSCELAFPESWQVDSYSMANAPAIYSHHIVDALRSPIGSWSLQEVAKGKKRVAIAIDDLARPTPSHLILPFVLEELGQAGITADQVTIVMALGSHPGLSEKDLQLKLGRDIWQRCTVVQHNAYGELQEIGMELAGIPVKVNAHFMQADLKLLMGCITPHPFAGFSGGGKMILPGLANIEIIERTHKSVVMGFKGGLGIVEGNQFRAEVHQVCQACSVDFNIDVVVNQERGIAGIFAGQVEESYHKGVAFARTVYRTKIPDQVDVAVLNAYPKDIDLIQSENAFNLYRSVKRNFVIDGGKVILMTASEEGMGGHGLFEPGGRLHRKPTRKRWLGTRDLLLFCPTVAAKDAAQLYWEGYPVLRTWNEVIGELQKTFDEHCRVAVFPCSSLQLGIS